MVIGTLYCNLGMFNVFSLLQGNRYFIALTYIDKSNVERTFWYRTDCVVPSKGINAFIVERTTGEVIYQTNFSDCN